jgi:hypothetical protein
VPVTQEVEERGGLCGGHWGYVGLTACGRRRHGGADPRWST